MLDVFDLGTHEVGTGVAKGRDGIVWRKQAFFGHSWNLQIDLYSTKFVS